MLFLTAVEPRYLTFPPRSLVNLPPELSQPLHTLLLQKVKVKFTLKQALEVQRGAKIQLYPFFNLGSRWGRYY